MQTILNKYNTLLNSGPSFGDDADLRKEFVDLGVEFFTELCGTLFGINSSQYTIDTDVDTCTVWLRLPAMHMRLAPVPFEAAKAGMSARYILSYCAAMGPEDGARTGMMHYAPVQTMREMQGTKNQISDLYMKSQMWLMHTHQQWRGGQV